MVAPLAGAWIEINEITSLRSREAVAPLAGAWIEIFITLKGEEPCLSLPSRERGLKLIGDNDGAVRNRVAPLAGAWIEITSNRAKSHPPLSRSPRGSVD